LWFVQVIYAALRLESDIYETYYLIKKSIQQGLEHFIEHAADNSAIKVAQIHGLSLEGHLSRQFTSSLGRQYDLILAMEKSHIEQIGHIAPEVRGKRCYLVIGWNNEIYLTLIVKVTKPSYQFINLLSRPVNFGLKIRCIIQEKSHVISYK
jgi:protein-tyrosine-phosphatase